MFGVKLTLDTEAGVRVTLNTLHFTLNTEHELNQWLPMHANDSSFKALENALSIDVHG